MNTLKNFKELTSSTPGVGEELVRVPKINPRSIVFQKKPQNNAVITKIQVFKIRKTCSPDLST
jgi:hypothetical protein